jgi:lipoate---protein ligase
MIKTAYYIEGSGTEPYHNCAFERVLFDQVGETACVLYLWQNRRTVVIGKNQNAWKECNCTRLESDGGFLARRLSGGGAVFHDTGNVNFTFLCRKENYDLNRQMQVILDMTRYFGIPAECSGRNDITVYGRKFSGNAFYRTKTSCCHHGTILLSSSTADIEKYLTVSPAKLAAKGVDSVKSRVTNLSEYAPDLTPDRVCSVLRESFAKVYGLPVFDYPVETIDAGAVARYEQQFSSWAWKYGRSIPFTCEAGRRFSCGEIDLQLQIADGCIADAVIWTDALDTDALPSVAVGLTGVRFVRADVRNRIDQIRVEKQIEPELADAVLALLEELL